MTDGSPAPPDTQADLARERNHLAADRTLLSFIRSSLTLISIGVGVEQILATLSTGDRAINPWAYGFSLVWIGLGVLSLALAIADHRAETKRLRASVYRYIPRWSIGEVTGLGVLATGIVALCWLGLSTLG
jgi:putative membrane protein